VGQLQTHRMLNHLHMEAQKWENNDMNQHYLWHLADDLA
jgi:hypothetical protein